MTIKRYDLVNTTCQGEAWREMEESEDGDYVLASDYDALAARLAEEESAHRVTAGIFASTLVRADAAEARLAEADALIAKGLAVVHDFLPNIGRCVLQDYQRMNEFCSEAAARTAVSAVQPERCCLDYPRCDCNSPPEPDSISDSAEVKP